MVKNRIKIYARLKKETKPCTAIDYTVSKVGENEVLGIFNKDVAKNHRGRFKFNFDKVFDTTSKQNELFDGIAKPIINGVLNGFNGTIFAYGPTGSGKTYSLTGSHTKYNNRGLIPRSIEYIFNFITKSFDSYVISISYLEIYNEIAYDLLNSKENVSTLEELPRVLLLEDHKGEAHYKNLSVLRVCSEEEAMRLLFLGDTNRTIAETPLNEYSSRSHCIFTLHVTARIQRTGKIIKSKLNLVDLAGSERVHKMNLNGISLCEAKYINLSLHYLEQVILAISETKRMHIPFRNSMMTFVLRDSISGNCLTAMLATLAMTKYNFEETIATCKFSQRVSLVKTDVQINEETDPHVEIAMLRTEIMRLRSILEDRDNTLTHKELEKGEEAECHNSISSFLYNDQEEELSLSDSRKVKFYIDFLKKEVSKSNSMNALKSKSVSEIEKKYKDIIRQKDEEISILKNIFDSKLQEHASSPVASNQCLFEVSDREKQAYEIFLSQPECKNSLDFYSNAFDEKHAMAAQIGKQIEEEQKKIKQILTSIEENRDNFELLQQLSFRLKTEQNIYRELLLKLQNIKSEIEYLKKGARLFERKLIADFKNFTKVNDKRSTSFVEDKSPSESSLHSKEHRRPFVLSKSKSEKFDIRAKLDELLNRMEVKSENGGDDLYPEKDVSSVKQNQQFMYGDDFRQNNGKIVRFNNDDNKIRFNNKVNLITDFFNERSKKFNLDNETSYFETSKKFEDNLNFFIEESLNVAEIKSFDVEAGDPIYKNELFTSSSNVNLNSRKHNADDSCDFTMCSSVDAEIGNYCTNDQYNYKRTDLSRPISAEGGRFEKPVRENCGLYKSDDCQEFLEFMKTVPMTGDADVDEEIVKFYRMKFKN